MPRAAGGRVAHVIGFCHEDAVVESCSGEGQRDGGCRARAVTHFCGQGPIECPFLLLLELPEENDGGLILCASLSEGMVWEREDSNDPSGFCEESAKIRAVGILALVIEQSIGNDQAKPAVSFKQVNGA